MAVVHKKAVENTPVRNHGHHGGSPVGLTDQTTPDLNGNVIPLPCALDMPVRK
jgi:hypothetical protein